MQRKHKRGVKKSNYRSKHLGELLLKNPHVLKVLNHHGINFCAGCYITLFSPPEKAASYHAVPDLKSFMKDLNAAAKKRRSN